MRWADLLLLLPVPGHLVVRGLLVGRDRTAGANVGGDLLDRAGTGARGGSRLLLGLSLRVILGGLLRGGLGDRGRYGVLVGVRGGFVSRVVLGLLPVGGGVQVLVHPGVGVVKLKPCCGRG